MHLFLTILWSLWPAVPAPGIRTALPQPAATVTLSLDAAGVNARSELLTLPGLRLHLPAGIRLHDRKGIPLSGAVQVSLTAAPGGSKTELELRVQTAAGSVDALIVPGAPLAASASQPQAAAPMQGAAYTVSETSADGRQIYTTVPASGEIPDMEDGVYDLPAAAKPGDVIVLMRRSGKSVLDFSRKGDPASVPGDQEYWLPVPASVPDGYRLVYYSVSYLEGRWSACGGSGWPGLAEGETVATDPDFAVSLVNRNGARYIRLRCRFHNQFYMKATFSHGDLKRTSQDYHPVEGLMEGGSKLEEHPGPYYGALPVQILYEYQTDAYGKVSEIERYLDQTVYQTDPKTAAIVFREFEDRGNGVAWCVFDLIGFEASERLLAARLGPLLSPGAEGSPFIYRDRILGITVAGYKRYNVESGTFVRKKTGKGTQISLNGEETVDFREWGRTEIVRGRESTTLSGRVIGEREWIALTHLDTTWTCELKNGAVTQSVRVVTPPEVWQGILEGYFNYNDPFQYGIAMIARAGWQKTGSRTVAGMTGEEWKHSSLGTAVIDPETALPLFNTVGSGALSADIEVLSFQSGKRPDERFRLPVPKSQIQERTLPVIPGGPSLPGMPKKP